MANSNYKRTLKNFSKDVRREATRCKPIYVHIEDKNTYIPESYNKTKSSKKLE